MEKVTAPTMQFVLKMAASMRQYLMCFAHEHVEFRLAELMAIVSLLGIKAEMNKCAYDQKNPFLLLKLPSDACARNIMSRTMLGRYMIELWGQGNSLPELYASLDAFPRENMALYTRSDTSFCFRMRALGKRIEMAEKLVLIEALAIRLGFDGRVDLNDAANEFHIYADYGLTPNCTLDKPNKMYFGRLISEGQRQLEKQYSVKTRHFIGNTSMDATLSLLMANHAKVKPGMVTFDPFVGTGSLLVAAAHFGSYILGGDININVIHGRGKTSRKGVQQYRGEDENIRANLRQYGLEHLYLDVLVSDFSCQVWRPQPVFDAIITDPPYGIRESTRKIGSNKESAGADEKSGDHIPAKTSYNLSSILTDLLNFSARFLRLHGRLVYWLPVCRPEYTEDQLPSHPCLTLVSNCEQVLSLTIGRRLITMEKTKQLEELDVTAEAEIKEDRYQDAYAIRDKVFGKHARELKLKAMAKCDRR